MKTWNLANDDTAPERQVVQYQAVALAYLLKGFSGGLRDQLDLAAPIINASHHAQDVTASEGAGSTESNARFDEDDTDVVFWIDAIQAESNNFAHGAMQFGGKLGARSAGTDNGDVKLTRPNRFALRLGPQAGI